MPGTGGDMAGPAGGKGQLVAGHLARHHHVGEQQVDLLAAVQDPQRGVVADDQGRRDPGRQFDRYQRAVPPPHGHV